MKNPVVSTLLATLALACVPGILAKSRPDADPRTYVLAAGTGAELDITNANGTLTVRLAKRGALDVSLDGKTLADERLIRNGSILRVVDKHERTLFMFGHFPKLGRHPQVIYSPNFDPDSSTTRFGLAVGRIDEQQLDDGSLQWVRSLTVRSGLDPERLLVVVRVHSDGPAAAAGVHESDLLIRADGIALQQGADLHRLAATKAPGDTIRLRLVREGGEQVVDLRLPPRGEWPDPGDLERQFRRVIRP